MNGSDCPIHGTPMHWLSTYNEWEYHCPTCDKRYNRKLEPMPPLDEISRLKDGMLGSMSWLGKPGCL